MNYDVNGEPVYRPVKIQFLGRKLVNKILFATYKLLKILYISVFYYMMPFNVIIFSTLVPIYWRGKPLQTESIGFDRLNPFYTYLKKNLIF